MFGLEDERLGADLQDGGRLQRRGDRKQCELRRNQLSVLRNPVLTVNEFQAAAEVQSLRTGEDALRHLCFLERCVCSDEACVCYQEAGGIVEQAAEATAEVSLQEGRVFRRHDLRVVGDQAAGDLSAVQFTCSTDGL